MSKIIFECPICKSPLEHERTDDGYAIHSISKTGEAEEIGGRSNGGDSIYCTNESSHEIPQDLFQAVLDLI